MMAAKPLPRPTDPQIAKFDAALNKIEATLPKIERRVKEAVKKGDTPPTGGFDIKNIKRTREAFQALSESSLLSDSGDDIPVNTPANGVEKPKKPGPFGP